MSTRNVLIIAIMLLGLGVSSNAYGQEKRQRSARKPSVSRPTPARAQARKPNALQNQPSQNLRRQAPATPQTLNQRSRMRNTTPSGHPWWGDYDIGKGIANRTETVDNNETLRKQPRVQPGNSGGTISNQRTSKARRAAGAAGQPSAELQRDASGAAMAGGSNGNSARSIRIPPPKGMNKADLTEQLSISSPRDVASGQATGKSRGTTSNQRTQQNSQGKLGNFEIQDLMSQALPLTSGAPRTRNLPQVQPGNSGGTISNQRTQQNSQGKLGNFEIQGISESQQQLDWIFGNFGVQGISEANALWQFVRPRSQTIRPKSIQSPRGN